MYMTTKIPSRDKVYTTQSVLVTFGRSVVFMVTPISFNKWSAMTQFKKSIIHHGCIKLPLSYTELSNLTPS